MKALGAVFAILTVAFALVACGEGGGPKFPQKAGEMPAGQVWEGVYYNQVYGYLHMVEQGNSIVGRWKRTNGSAWGELNGTVEGNLLRYTWTEHKIGVIEPNGGAHGNGVFVYKLPKDSDIAELDGQYALADSDSVAEWHCVKQNNVKADINSINGDNPDAPVAPKDSWQ